MNNWYLEPTGESGQLVLIVNPMWAERFGKVFPEIESFQQYLWENAWQPIDLVAPGQPGDPPEQKPGRQPGPGLLDQPSRSAGAGRRWRPRQPPRHGADQLLRK